MEILNNNLSILVTRYPTGGVCLRVCDTLGVHANVLTVDPAVEGLDAKPFEVVFQTPHIDQHFLLKHLIERGHLNTVASTPKDGKLFWTFSLAKELLANAHEFDDMQARHRELRKASAEAGKSRSVPLPASQAVGA